MRVGWIALLSMAIGCGWIGAENSPGTGEPGGATVSERNAAAPPDRDRPEEEGGAFWCLPDGPAGESGQCFTSRQQCAAQQRERGRDGESPPACERRMDDAWCHDTCDSEGQCGSACYASADECSGGRAPCNRFAPPETPFHPVGKRWWCYAAGTLGHCYRQERSCRILARQMASDGTVVTGCAIQPRAACLVVEEAMRDQFTVSCFASTTDCSFAADRSNRDPDRRIIQKCVVWE